MLQRLLVTAAITALSLYALGQTLPANPHGPGLRGLSPATETAGSTVKWSTTLPRGVAHGSITFSNNGEYLYFKTFGPTLQGKVFKVKASDGSVVWSTDETVIGFGTYCYSGVTVDEAKGLVYTTGRGSSQPAGGSIIAALKMSDGTVQWQKTSAQLTTELGVTIGDLGRGNVLVSPDGSTIYTRDNSGNTVILALNAATGSGKWAYVCMGSSGLSFQTVGPVWTDPATGKTRLAYVNNSVIDTVGVIQDDGASASSVWSQTVALDMNYHWWGNGVLSLDNQTLYVTSFKDAGNPVLTALKTSDGTIEWQIFNTPTNELNQYQNPCIGADGTIYTGGRVPAPPPIYVGKAAVGADGDYWNSVVGSNSLARPWTATNLRTAADTPTNLSVELVDFAETSTYTPDNGDLMRDYAYLGANGYYGPAFIRLKNVPAGAYNVYLYAFTPAGTDQNPVFLYNAEFKTVVPSEDTTFSGNFVEGENYVKYTGVTPDANGTIEIQVDIDNAMGHTYCVVNGMQLEPVSSPLTSLVNVDFNQFGNVGGGLTAIRPDGTIKWQYVAAASGEFTGWPTVTTGGVIYLADQGPLGFSDSRLYAIKDNGNTAELLWQYTLAGNYFGNVSPAVGLDGTVFVASNLDQNINHPLLAFGLPKATVTGKVVLEDIIGQNPSYDYKATFKIYKSGNTNCATPDAVVTADLDAGGNYSFQVNPLGTGCTVVVKAGTQTNMDSSARYHFLAKKLTGVDLSGNAVLATVNLPNGDVNDDNIVDAFDFTILMQAYDIAEDTTLGETDLTNDGAVDAFDFTILMLTYDTAGDECN